MKIKTRDMILVALFAALTVVGGYISIPVGSVPISLQSFFSLLSGLLLGPYLGALSQLIYVILGIVGLPVYAGGTGGISSVFHPSFGYLIGFIIAPIIVGIITRSSKVGILRVAVACILGSLSIYIIGLPYMYIILRYVSNVNIGILKTFETGFFIFIPGDAVKCIIASIIGVKILPAIRKIRRRNNALEH
ncbi:MULTISPECIES: biotin transporter BioY [Clostridium]|uniref:biotin transporter BioY n=1 Tax=Clostridium TaxID=1485 RepID=UPI00082459DD|nr:MULTISPECIES: biotin transporter BioY [Clostridium]PJI08978.1 biotin transporter BioY [Clostridium sp. CT7]